MIYSRLFLLFIIFFQCINFASANNNDAPFIVTTIAPIAHIAAGVTEGITKPSVLVPNNQSPHHYRIKPSDLNLLKKADLIIWIDPALESFMPNVLSKFPKTPELRLLETKGLKLYNVRNGDNWQAHSHGDLVDPHIWLSPENAAAIADTIAKELSKLDPKNKEKYLANAEIIKDDLETIKSLQNHIMSNIKNKKFLVLHDGFQYFEKSFNVTATGSLMWQPGQSTSAKHLRELSNTIEKENIICLFKEPQTEDKVASNLANRFQLKLGELDPIGKQSEPKITGYYQLLENIGTSLYNCLNAED